MWIYFQSLFLIDILGSWKVNDLRWLIGAAIALLLFLVFISASIAAYVWSKMTASLATQRQIILMACINWLNACILSLVNFIAAPPGHAPPTHEYYIRLCILLMIDIVFAGFAFLSLRYFRIHHKLQSAGEGWNVLPPSDAAAA